MLTTCYYAQNNASIFYAGQATGSPPVIPSRTSLMLLGSLTFQRGMGGSRLFILFPPFLFPPRVTIDVSDFQQREVAMLILFSQVQNMYTQECHKMLYETTEGWVFGTLVPKKICTLLVCDVPQNSYLVHASYYKFKKALHENQADVHFHQITWLEGVLLQRGPSIYVLPQHLSNHSGNSAPTEMAYIATEQLSESEKYRQGCSMSTAQLFLGQWL